MIGGVIEGNTLHTLDPSELIGQVFRFLIGDIGHHDLRRAVGGKLLLHQIEGDLCPCGIRQERGEVVFDLDPIAGEGRENEHDDGDEEKQVAAIHNEGGQPYHKGGFIILLFHGRFPPSG